MRVDGLQNNQAAIRATIADLLGRLDTGDLIRAKVLEITSNEVVLRLFDGSLLRAAAGEDLDVKAGQTLTLVVTSRNEGTLFLETVKNQSQMGFIKPDLLKNLLNMLGLKPDAGNLELASEFIKSGITPNKEQFDAASALMKEFNELSAEKAVFLSSKGIQGNRVNMDLLTGLLDGDVKLGEQLKALQSALENTVRNNTGAAPESKSGNMASGTAGNSGNAAVSALLGRTAADVKNAAAAQTSEIKTAVQLQETAGIKQTGISAGNHGVPVSGPAEEEINAASVSSPDSKGISPKPAASQAAAEQNDSLSKNANSLDVRSALSGSQGTDGRPVNGKTGQNAVLTSVAADAADSANAAGTADAADNKAARLPGTLADNIAGKPDQSGSDAADPFTKLRDAVKDIFIRLDPDKSSEWLDLGKSHKELGEKLDMLKSVLQSAGMSGQTNNDAIAAAANRVDDSSRLLNQLNSSNMLYYQLPVSLAGMKTTAELYVMNRQKGKKRIDPHNSVLFVSLDTNHLGRFETLIDVKGNTVTLNFRTEKKEINELVKQNIKLLYTGLSGCGYKLVDIRYALIDSATPPIKMEKLLIGMIDSSQSKVDMRI